MRVLVSCLVLASWMTGCGTFDTVCVGFEGNQGLEAGGCRDGEACRDFASACDPADECDDPACA